MHYIVVAMLGTCCGFVMVTMGDEQVWFIMRLRSVTASTRVKFGRTEMLKCAEIRGNNQVMSELS